MGMRDKGGENEVKTSRRVAIPLAPRGMGFTTCEKKTF
jgi:hypothetical protein